MRGKDLYRQSFGFTCGPAALMMVMRDYDRSMPMNRSTELEIWRESTLMVSRATSSFGLALSARERGFSVRLQSDSDTIGFIKKLEERFSPEEVSFMEMIFRETRRKARDRGIEEITGRVRIKDISGELVKNRLPIVLLSTSLMDESDPIPHWVVISSLDRKSVKILNPEYGAKESYPLERFSGSLGFEGHTCMLSIWK
jgi:hypothetical protein